MSRFNDVREPIEYVVNQYFEKKKSLASNYEEDGYTPHDGSYIDDNLPEYPLRILRDENNRAHKFIYGNLDALLNDEDADPLIWQEELIRTDGKVTSIIRTYPDGEEVENVFIRENDKLIEIT